MWNLFLALVLKLLLINLKIKIKIVTTEWNTKFLMKNGFDGVSTSLVFLYISLPLSLLLPSFQVAKNLIKNIARTAHE